MTNRSGILTIETEKRGICTFRRDRGGNVCHNIPWGKGIKLRFPGNALYGYTVRKEKSVWISLETN